MKFRTIVTTAMLASLAPAAFSQTAASDPAAKIDALFAKATIDTPGCAVGVAQKGKTVVERAYGAADLEHGVPSTPATIYESGSVAKQFTAAAVLLLEKDGKLKLSDDIRKHLPEMPDYGDKITIEMLLNHTSGLRDWGSVAAAAGKPRGERTFNNAEVLDIASRQKALNYKPGAEYAYTNTGYNLAAIIVERVSGKSFPDFTKERIFTPLGMTHTQWRDDFNRIVKGRAMAYVRAQDGYKQSMPFMNVVGNGGMLTTIGDFLIWNEALTQDKLGLAKALERQGVLNDGRTIVYARGVEVRNYKSFTEISHSGSTGGYTTWLARFPDQALSIVLLCNGPPPREFSHPYQLADLFLPAAPASSPPAAAKPSADAEQLAGTFINTATGVPAKLAVADGALQLSQAGIPPLSMTRQPDGRWKSGGVSWLPVAATAIFNGKDRFSLETADGNRYEYARTTPATLAADKLAEFAGAYTSEEAAATYRIAAENGRLVLRIDRWPDQKIELTPAYKDAFTAGFNLFRFRRDAAGRITELSWGDNRMRDLRAPRVK